MCLSYMGYGLTNLPIGAGPRIFDLMGSIERLPTIRISVSSLKDEW
jgi:hypothetical protein